MSDLTGRCRCGEIRFTISGQPKFQVHCQCTDCQRTTGSGHAAIMIFNMADFVLDGESATFSYVSDDGNTVTHHFCRDCGAPLFNRNSQYDKAVYVMVGSLDDPSVFAPQRIVYASSGQAWDVMDPELPGFEGMPKR